MEINNVNYTKPEVVKQPNKKNTVETAPVNTPTEGDQVVSETKVQEEAAAVYTPSSEEEVYTDTGYKVDMKTVIAMKTETDQRMVDLFRESVKSGFMKQHKGLKHFVDFINSERAAAGLESLEKTNGLANIQYDENDLQIALGEPKSEAVTETTEATALEEDDYWSPENMSTRLLDFAKALSGGDKSKGAMLLEAVKEGYEAAKGILGLEEMPETSQKTLEMTIEKFKAWYEEDAEVDEAMEGNDIDADDPMAVAYMNTTATEE